MKHTLTLCLMLSALLGTYALSIVKYERDRRPGLILKNMRLSDVIEQEREAWDMPKGLIEAVIHHETGGKWDETMVNPEKESSCYKRAKTRTQRAQCASVGLMQTVTRLHVTGRATPEQVMSDGKLSVIIGVASKLGPCWQQYQNAWGAAYCWNGSGPKAVKYADKFMASYAIWKNLG